MQTIYSKIDMSLLQLLIFWLYFSYEFFYLIALVNFVLNSFRII